MAEAASPEFEVVELVQEPPIPELLGSHLDWPKPGTDATPFDAIGWVIPKRGRVDRVEILGGRGLPVVTRLNHARPDLGQAARRGPPPTMVAAETLSAGGAWGEGDLFLLK
jgi:hypothetical protein